MKTYCETVEQIFRLSQEMLNYSKCNDWDKVVDIEKQRQDVLTDLSNMALIEFDLTAEKILHEIICINTEVEMLSRIEMENCKINYNEIQNKKSAINAYSSL